MTKSPFRILPVTVAAVFVALSLLGWQRAVLLPGSTASPARMAPVSTDDSMCSLRVRFGMTDSGPFPWDGSLAVEGGELIELRNWHPRPGDKVEGNGKWSLATRKGPNFVRRAWEVESLSNPESYLLNPGLVVAVKAGPQTRIQFKTGKGDFQVRPLELKPGTPAAFLGGGVVVDRLPVARLLSAPEFESDFATISAGPDGDLWASWIAYRKNANRILARHFDGRTWAPAIDITEKPGDIFLVKLARDRNKNLWAIWSEQVDGNWDLYGRFLSGNSWSKTTRLTEEPQPDIYHCLAPDSSGNLWLVWQGFRNGKSQIFTRRYDGRSWSQPEELSSSQANSWEPAVAADGTGRVYAAWDTYAKGNYDVVMRPFENGAWREQVEVASSPKFEAHVSLACDRENRLWAAWNESGFQWGKDTGFLVKKEGTRLYQSRSVGTAVYLNGIWQQPAAEFDNSLPADLTGYNDLPTLQYDGVGRVWLFFRHRTLRVRDTPSDASAHRAAWEIFATTYEGGAWLSPIALPFSQGRQDMRGGISSDNRGNVYAAWPTDNRDFEDFLFRHADVYAASVPLPGAPTEPAKLVPRPALQLKVFPIHLKEAEDLARIRGYEIRSGGSTYHIYRGDVHRHTEFSHDGNNDGSMGETYRYAMDAAALDFLGVSDHSNLGGPDIEYVNWLQQQMADLFHLPNTFTPLYAYERSLAYPNGHRNVVFDKRGVPTLPIPKEEHEAKTGAQALFEYLKKNGGISIPHTSASSMGTDWRDNDPAVEPLVEIFQGDRVSAEYEGAPKAAHAGNQASAPGGFRPAGYVWNAWAKGYKLGVQSSSDHLSTHLSYACTLAEDSSRAGLVNAMRRRHSYGATDNIILDYRLQAGDREYLQGDSVSIAGDFKLWMRIIGTAPIRQLDIIKNNKFIHTIQPAQRDLTIAYVDAQAGQGPSYYYVRVIQVDEQMAWSSPIWVRK